VQLKDLLGDHIGTILTATVIGIGSLTVNNTVTNARHSADIEAIAESLQDLKPELRATREQTVDARIEIERLREELSHHRPKDTQ
jgi:uncharacterized protein (DUF3084 family)